MNSRSHIRSSKPQTVSKTKISKTRIIMIGAVATLAAAYFFQITVASSRGYELKKLADERAALTNETRDLDLQVAEQGSAEELQKRTESLGLKPNAQVQYAAAPGENSVAFK